MTERLYLLESGPLEFDAIVRSRRDHDGRPAVVLDRTAFYPQSGGQPWDKGTLGAAQVLAVLEVEGEILHVLDRPLADERARGVVDADRRRDHTQQHHGQHLLSRAFVEVAAAGTVAFHLGADVTTIDLDRPVAQDQTAAAERLANDVVWSARPVHVTTLDAGAARRTGIEPPEGATATVRVVEVEGFDRQPCGGTHPRCTAEVGVVLITACEKYKGGTRVSFVCGYRALSAVRKRLDVLDHLVPMLSAPLDELVAAARKAKDDLAAAQRHADDLLQRALDGDARRLLAEARGSGLAPTPSAPALVVAVFDGWPPGDLRVLASKIVAHAPAIALLAGRSEKAHLVFAQSDGLPHDIPALLNAALEIVGGRGGGRGNLAQGGGDRVDRLEEALARVKAKLSR